MKIKKLLLGVSVVAPLAFANVAYAVSTPSDYAQDVQQGQNQLTSDGDAKSQANEVKEGEIIEGQVDDGRVEVNETVGQQENEASDGQSAESSSGGGSESSGSASGNASSNPSNGSSN